jgi:hypothetical protein
VPLSQKKTMKLKLWDTYVLLKSHLSISLVVARKLLKQTIFFDKNICKKLYAHKNGQKRSFCLNLVFIFAAACCSRHFLTTWLNCLSDCKDLRTFPLNATQIILSLCKEAEKFYLFIILRCSLFIISLTFIFTHLYGLKFDDQDGRCVLVFFSSNFFFIQTNTCWWKKS